MTGLIMTPEEAYVAELLAAPPLTRAVPALDPGDFTEPHAQAIYQAILDASARAGAEELYDQRGFLRDVAGLVQDDSVDEAMLVRFAEAASHDPYSSAMAGSYARMIAEAAIHRELIQHGQRLAGDPASRDLGDRLLQAAEEARTVAEAARDLPSQPSPEHASVELAVLAGVLASPAEAGEVTRWLPAEAFGEGIRRDIYQAITGITRAGDPLNAGSVMDLLAQQRDPGGLWLAKYEAMSWYFQFNLDPVHAPPGTAILAGRDLLTAHTIAELNHAASQASAAPRAEAAYQPAVAEQTPHAAPGQIAQPLQQPPPAPQPEPGPEPQP
jgi:hypothetical protein